MEVLAFGERAWESLTHDKMKNQFDLMMLTSTYQYIQNNYKFRFFKTRFSIYRALKTVPVA